MHDEKRKLFLVFYMKHTLHLIGKITKTHGYDGTVVLLSDATLVNETENLKELFLLIDGLQVPFPVQELVLITAKSARVKLEFVDDKDQARELTGCEAYATIAPANEIIEEGFEKWRGFEVYDSKYGRKGIIQKVEDYNGNTVMHLMDGKNETLISIFPELVNEIDENKKKMYITAPEGCFSS